MQLTEAVKMLANDKFNFLQKEKWADLGCGNGTFTLALAQLLQTQSIIYAVDIDKSALNQIPAEYNSVRIEKIQGDFEAADLPFKNLDGILMANSLHYIKDKNSFIQKAVGYLEETGHFLLVEYDTDQANKWVPYPLSFSSLTRLFNKAGFHSIRKLQERTSLFGRSKMYSALIGR
jgi:ubiquinone/menaquinone biosynthesis C-methylase UbiE